MLKWPKSIKISNYSCYLLLPRISFVATNTVDESLEYANGIFNFVLLYFIWNENNRRTIFIGSTWDFNRFFTSDSRYPTKKIRFSCMYPNNYMFPKDNFFSCLSKTHHKPPLFCFALTKTTSSNRADKQSWKNNIAAHFLMFLNSIYLFSSEKWVFIFG